MRIRMGMWRHSSKESQRKGQALEELVTCPGMTRAMTGRRRRLTEKKGSEEIGEEKERLTESARDLISLKAEVKAAEGIKEEKEGAGKKEKSGRERKKSGKGSPAFQVRCEKARGR